MKKFFIVFFIIITLIFSGCGARLNIENRTTNETSMFVLIENSNAFLIVYHQDTKVMYAVSNGGYNSGNFCLLVNPDGTPMLWEGATKND